MSFLIATLFLLFSSFILGAVLFFTSNYSTYTIAYAQFQNNMSSSSLLGVNITSPQKGQQIPANIVDLTISGKSTDKPAADDCQVSVIVNSIKPYQHAIANGSTGEKNDYSRWFFILNSNYTSIKEGANKITAKLSCLPTVVSDDNNMTKWYSINVTGITTRNNNTTIPTQTSPAINSSAEFESNNKDQQQQSLEPKAKEEQEKPIFNSNKNKDKKIEEEIENLKERIVERVEKSLEEMGIELNLP
jgi:hypothetical protein